MPLIRANRQPTTVTSVEAEPVAPPTLVAVVATPPPLPELPPIATAVPARKNLMNIGLDGTGNDEAPPAETMPELKVFRHMGEVDLMEEVLTQLAHAIRLRNHIATDKNTPANQKAQVNNSCANLILQLTKAQTDLYSADRLKRQEACLIKCLRTLPDHVVASFFEMYEAELKDV